MNKKTVLLFFTFFIGLSHLTKAQNLDWAFQLGNIGEEDYVKDAITDTMDNVYMVGYYLADMDVDPGPDVYTLTSPDITVGYITKYNTSGELVWAKQIDGDGVALLNEKHHASRSNHEDRTHHNAQALRHPAPLTCAGVWRTRIKSQSTASRQPIS